MADDKGSLGIFGAIISVFVIVGLLALVANYFGWLPQY